MARDEGAGDAAVEVQVADAELLFGKFEVAGLAAEDAAGELVRQAVGDGERVLEGVRVHDGEHGAEDLFARDGVRGFHAAEDVWRDKGEGAEIGERQSQFERAALLLGFLDAGEDLLLGLRVDDGADVGAGARRVADDQRSRRFDDALDDLADGWAVLAVGVDDDQTRARRALLALEAECGVTHGEDGFVEIGGGVDDDGVLAAHLAHDLFDVGVRTGGPLGIGRPVAAERRERRGCVEDVAPDVPGAGEGDDRDPFVAHEVCADGLAGARAEVHHVGRPLEHAQRVDGLRENLAQDAGDAGCLLGGLHDDGVPADECGDGHAAADGQWKVPWSDHDGHAAGLIPDLVEFAEESADTLALKELDGLTRVILAEIDGLAGVGVGLAPGLASFLDHDPGEFVATLTHELGRSGEDGGTLEHVGVAPGREGGFGGVDHGSGGIDAGGVLDLGHAGLLDSRGKGITHGPLREVAEGLVEERPTVADAGDG